MNSRRTPKVEFVMTKSSKSRLLSEADIDWDQEFTWVHDYTKWKAVPQDDGFFRLSGAAGKTLVVTRVDLESQFVPSVDKTYHLRRFSPARAFCLEEAVEIMGKSGVRRRLKAGDAIIRRESGDFDFIPAADYAANYRAVALRGTKERPAYPFPEIDMSDRWW